MRNINFILFFFSNILCLTAQPGCWNNYPNSQSNGGIQNGFLPSLWSCQKSCQSRPDCKAIEWLGSLTVGTNCYIFMTPSPPTFSGRTGIDHYISQCTCNWEAYPGKQSFGGALQSQVSTLEQCKEACYKDSNCSAIEFTVPQNQCFLFSSDVVPTNNAAGITHYIYMCTLPSSVTPSDRPSVGCYWTSKTGTGTHSGQLQINARTLYDCKFVCVQTNSCKFGFDWNPPAQQCWVSTTSNEYNAQSVDHYTYNCEANVVSWDVAVNKNSPGGTVQTTVTSIDDCKAACIDSGFCVFGFDWDNNKPIGQQCWLSSNFNRTLYLGVDHYDPVRGTGTTTISGYESDCTWTSFPNSNSPFGTPKDNLTTLADCQKECIRIRCKGIDWDQQGVVKCWLSTMDVVFLGAFPGVTHYNYTCPGFSTTTTAPRVITKLGQDCDYVLYVNSKSSGGTEQSYKEFDSCKNQCTVQQNCKAFEWWTNATRCFFYNSGNPPNIEAPDVNFYLFRKCT